MTGLHASSGDEVISGKTTFNLTSNPYLSIIGHYVRMVISQKSIKPAVMRNVLKISCAAYENINIIDRIMRFEFETGEDIHKIMDQSS